MDELQDYVKTKRLLEEVTRTVTAVVRSRFSSLMKIESEDIAQDVLIKVLRAAERGTKFDNLGSYLWRVCYTTALDVLEAKSKQIRIIESIESERPVGPGGSPAVECAVDREIVRGAMDRILEALPSIGAGSSSSTSWEWTSRRRPFNWVGLNQK